MFYRTVLFFFEIIIVKTKTFAFSKRQRTENIAFRFKGNSFHKKNHECYKKNKLSL